MSRALIAVSLMASVLVFLSSCGGGSSSTGGPRQRFITFNPSSGTFYAVDVFPRDTAILTDSRNLGPSLDGYAASEFGTIAIVFDDATGFLVFVSYANPNDLISATTDIGRVGFDIGSVSMTSDGTYAIFVSQDGMEIQLLDLSDLTNLVYSDVILLDDPVAEVIHSPENLFSLIFPAGRSDQLLIVDLTDFQNPVQEFDLPTTSPLQFFEFTELNPEVAIGVEQDTGQFLTFSLTNAIPAGEVVADSILLMNPDIESVTIVPGKNEAYLGSSDGKLVLVDFENPFRVFVNDSLALTTGAAGDDLIVSVSPDGTFLFATAQAGFEIYDITDPTSGLLLRRFDFASPVLEVGYETESAARFQFVRSTFVVVGGSVHLIDLRNPRLPELSSPTTFPAFTQRILQEDPIGGRLVGPDAAGSVTYLSISSVEENAPIILGTFSLNPPIGAGYAPVTFFVR